MKKNDIFELEITDMGTDGEVEAARYRRSPMKSSLNLKIIRCATISCV